MDLFDIARKLGLSETKHLVRKVAEFRRLADVQFDSSVIGVVAGTIRNCCFETENHLQDLLLISEFLWPALLLPVAGNKVYSEEDTRKMPLELASALSIEREPVTDPEIRVQSLEAIYLLILQSSLWSSERLLHSGLVWCIGGYYMYEAGFLLLKEQYKIDVENMISNICNTM